MVVAEKQLEGKISWRDYRAFLRFGMGCCGGIFFLLICAVTAFVQLIPSYLLAVWAS